ncbi:FXR2, partial [Symbiodinium necroappetens]
MWPQATSDQGRQGARRRSAEIVEVNEALDEERLLRSSLLATAALAVFRGLGGAAGASSRSELLQTLTLRLAPSGSPARCTLRSWLRRLRLCRAREVVLPDDRLASKQKVSGVALIRRCGFTGRAVAFVLPGASPVVPATSAPGLPRHSTGRWQGLAGLAGPCVAAAAALSAATRRTRCARVVRSALSDNPWEDVNKRTRTKGKTQGGAPWFAPGWGEEGDEDEEEELERKKPVEESVYCCWVMPKKTAADFLKEWAEEEEASDEQKDLL